MWRDITFGPPDPTGVYVGDPSGPILGVLKHRIWTDFRKLVDGAGIAEGRRLTAALVPDRGHD